MRLLFLLTAILASALSVGAAEQDALAISANIQTLHTPYGSLLDPVFASPESNEVVSYTRCGDSPSGQDITWRPRRSVMR